VSLPNGKVRPTPDSQTIAKRVIYLGNLLYFTKSQVISQMGVLSYVLLRLFHGDAGYVRQYYGPVASNFHIQ
jgi:hypothetical protein